MALKFDEKTGSLMEPIITDTLKFISVTGEIIDAKDEETLLYESENIDTTLSLSNVSVFIKNALSDRTNPRDYILCQKCEKMQVCVLIRHDSKKIRVCTKCSHVWI